ncbi:MAG: hypothetical protein F6K54_41000 [Okeania sp. SIO3B5]|uniref:hypothetical protein n=1 Tax=Okeania sp. SIO3B5 TaxID=2607811 RepID=UPI001401132C|nr:hypothetical protein [Okeania sp. SIO3B5]NEO58853.1 hypothetical protein [Okeania sp. SIO3B5]
MALDTAIKIKTSKHILSSKAVRGCLSCRGLYGQNNRTVERARMQVARTEVISNRELQQWRFAKWQALQRFRI